MYVKQLSRLLLHVERHQGQLDPDAFIQVSGLQTSHSLYAWLQSRAQGATDLATTAALVTDTSLPYFWRALAAHQLAKIDKDNWVAHSSRAMALMAAPRDPSTPIASSDLDRRFVYDERMWLMPDTPGGYTYVSHRILATQEAVQHGWHWAPAWTLALCQELQERADYQHQPPFLIAQLFARRRHGRHQMSPQGLVNAQTFAARRTLAA